MDARHGFQALALLASPLLILASSFPALAQTKPSAQRSTFPGRRVGGGTRAVCSSRPLAHLVPLDSVYTPDSQRLIGLLEGPSQSPVPVKLVFRPRENSPAGSSGSPTPPVSPASRLLPATGAGITLFSAPPLQAPLVWESSYVCEVEKSADANTNLLDFVSSASPPPLTLLEENVSPEPTDLDVQKSLQVLQRSCGSSVASSDVATFFDLNDVISEQWPTRLAVRCLE